jgi:hypothetical protein
MTINVVFNGTRFFVEPNPAVVSRGTPMDWRLYYDGAKSQQVKWTLSFPSGVPFPRQTSTYQTMAPPIDPATGEPTEAKIDLGPPVRVGVYKYDVLVEDAATGRDLGNDDPYLIIRP